MGFIQYVTTNVKFISALHALTRTMYMYDSTGVEYICQI